MRHIEKIRIAICIVGALLFNTLFWGEAVGINQLIFSTLLLIIDFAFRPLTKQQHIRLILWAAVFLTGFFVAYHNSIMARFTHYACLILAVGISSEEELKSLLYALPASVTSFFSSPVQLGKDFIKLVPENKSLKPAFKYLRLSVVPLIFVFIFFLIYSNANRTFGRLTENIFKSVIPFLESIFENFSLVRFVFICFGILITAWATFNHRSKIFTHREAEHSDIIKRIRRKSYSNNFMIDDDAKTKNMLALKFENLSGTILLVLVNLLLLLVNFIDLSTVWFNYEYEGSPTLVKDSVHQGTYLLIFSIFLSMALLLYYFRRNQNFYAKKKRLVLLANIWVTQNAFLLLSVFLRNFYYIQHHGLAYKRIGLLFFLAVTLVGLFTMYLKIKDKKSAYYLLKTNAWAVFAAFIIMSAINWDFVIIKHNLKNHSDNLDGKFLLELSYKTLPIIAQHPEIIEAAKEQGYMYDEPEEYYTHKLKRFKQKKAHQTWKSWSYLESRALKEISN